MAGMMGRVCGEAHKAAGEFENNASSLLADGDAGRDCTYVDPSTGFLSLTGAYMVPTGLSAEVFCFVIAL